MLVKNTLVILRLFNKIIYIFTYKLFLTYNIVLYTNEHFLNKILVPYIQNKETWLYLLSEKNL